MQRRQTVIRLALLISLTLHLAAFLNMREVSLHFNIYNSPDAVQVDLMKLPSSKVKSPPIIPPPRLIRREIEPIRKIKKTRISPRGASPGRPLANKSLQREFLAKLPDPKTEIPSMELSLNTSPRQTLPNPVFSSSSSSSAIGASSKGTGQGSLSGQGKGSAGGILSISPRLKPREDASIIEKLQVYSEADIPFIKALQLIAQHVLNVTAKNRKVDIVFIVDTSESMEDDIDSVRRHLNKMIERFQSANLDFTLGVVRFHHSLVYEWLGTDIIVSQQTSDVEEVKRTLKSIKVSGGERALDALMKAVSEVKFRPDADRHFILVTDEYVHGTYPVSEVLKAAKRAKIAIDVLGMDEPFQRTIAEQTGGIWTSIEQITGE